MVQDHCLFGIRRSTDKSNITAVDLRTTRDLGVVVGIGAIPELPIIFMRFPFFLRTVIDRRIAEPRQFLTFAIREDRPCVAIDLSYRFKQFLLNFLTS